MMMMMMMMTTMIMIINKYKQEAQLILPNPRDAFRGQSRSSEPTGIDRQPVISYQRYIATLSLSRTVSEINDNFHGKSRKIQYPV